MSKSTTLKRITKGVRRYASANPFITQIKKSEPAICYAVLPSQMIDPTVKAVTPIIIKEGERGYYPTDWSWKKEHAQELCNQKNAAMGISYDRSQQMLAASMFGPPLKNKENALAQFLATWTDGTLLSDIGPSLSCQECEALAELLEFHERHAAAKSLRLAHSVGDEEGDLPSHLKIIADHENEP